MKKNITVPDLSKAHDIAEILVDTLPYIKRFAGKTVVIKIGGEIADDLEKAKSFAQDLLLMKAVGVRVVLCHGGGPQISRAMEKYSKEPVFKDGLRVTDGETLEIAAMVMLGEVNRAFVSHLNAEDHVAVGLSGIDARLFNVSPNSEGLGFVGDIEQVSTAYVTSLLNQGYLPVVASLGLDQQGNTYNINADIAAGELAAALQAEKLIILTNVPGLYESIEDHDSLISEIDLEGLQQLYNSSTLSAGMIPKIGAVIKALRSGVHSAHILDGRMLHVLLLEVFTPEGIGTMITGNI